MKSDINYFTFEIEIKQKLKIMKKLFYLVVALCFIQVGISKAQSSVTTDKQKKEVVTTTTTTDTKQVSNGSCDSKKSMTTKSSCSPSSQAPSCCQKKGVTTTSGCSGASSTATTSGNEDAKKNKLNKQDVQKDVSVKQNLGTTPK